MNITVSVTIQSKKQSKLREWQQYTNGLKSIANFISKELHPHMVNNEGFGNKVVVFFSDAAILQIYTS